MDLNKKKFLGELKANFETIIKKQLFNIAQQNKLDNNKIDKKNLKKHLEYILNNLKGIKFKKEFIIETLNNSKDHTLLPTFIIKPKSLWAAFIMHGHYLSHRKLSKLNKYTHKGLTISFDKETNSFKTEQEMVTLTGRIEI